MTIRKSIERYVLAAAAMAVTMGSSQAADVVMRVSHQLPPNHHVAQLIDEWGQAIAAHSGDEIEVQIFPANQAFPPDQNFPAVAQGQIEAAFSVNFQWGGTVPTMNVTLRPYSVTDIDLLRRWPGSEPARFLDERLAEVGVHNAVWLFTTNTSAITSSDAPIIAPSDFEGIKIRGLNRLVDVGLEALGAAPTPMPGSEVVQSLQTGVIDAGLTDISAVYSRRYYEVQDYVTVTPMFSVFFHGYINPDWWAGLTDEQRAAIDQASAEAALTALDKTEEAAGAAPQQLADEGMSVHIHTAEEVAAIKAIMEPAFTEAFLEASGDEGQELLDLIDQM